jgi:hypothetical protein
MQTTPAQRAAIFWGICIPTRLYLSITAGQLTRAFAAAVAYSWLSGNVSSVEGLFGGRAWWAEERVYHGMLWGAFAYSNNKVFLLLDTLYGGVNWLST